MGEKILKTRIDEGKMEEEEWWGNETDGRKDEYKMESEEASR